MSDHKMINQLLDSLSAVLRIQVDDIHFWPKEILEVHTTNGKTQRSRFMHSLQ